MALITPKTLIEDAIKNNYALAAFNINNLESLQAVIWAAEKEDSPAIIQLIGDTEDYVKDKFAFQETVQRYAEKSSAPLMVHHDHCSSLDEFKAAVDAGFQSAMFDGSALPFEENIEKTKQAADYAHKHGVWIEAELGSIPSMAAVAFSENMSLTDPEAAATFIRETGCDSLAIAIGTAHGGVRNDGHLPMYFDRLKTMCELCPDFPFVLHGGASLPVALIEEANRYGGNVDYMHICSEEDVAKACRNGVHKVNMDVDNWLVFTTTIRKFFAERPEVYNHRLYLDEARTAYMDEVRHKLKTVVHSSGCAKTFYKYDNEVVL